MICKYLNYQNWPLKSLLYFSAKICPSIWRNFPIHCKQYFTQLTLYLRGLGGADSYPGCLTLGYNPLQFEQRSQTDEIIRRHQSEFILKTSNSKIWDSLSEHLLTMAWNVSLLFFFSLNVANTITDSVQPKQSHMPTIRASYTQIFSQLTTVWSQKIKQFDFCKACHVQSFTIKLFLEVTIKRKLIRGNYRLLIHMYK